MISCAWAAESLLIVTRPRFSSDSPTAIASASRSSVSFDPIDLPRATPSRVAERHGVAEAERTDIVSQGGGDVLGFRRVKGLSIDLDVAYDGSAGSDDSIRRWSAKRRWEHPALPPSRPAARSRHRQ